MFTTADWIVVIAFFGLMASLGFVTRRLIHGLDDYFAGGHGIPWWLAAISHHVSGYSAFAFVGYASLAYKVGFNIWTVFALPVFLAMLAGAFIWAPRWTRLKVITPCQYLEERFNNLVRQVVAWSGIGVKFVDEGAKLYSLAKIINACTGLPVKGTIVASCAVTILYLLMGGLWAELYSDFIQFIVQYGITLALVPMVLAAVGGWRAMWRDPRTPAFSLLSKDFPLSRLSVFLVVITLSYNGGTWGLAQRFYSMGKAAEAKKAALLSAFLYLLYPIALYIPVWAAPILVGQVQDPEMAYIIVAQQQLPRVMPGLLGLLVAGMFAATMSMVNSDISALAAVFTKDIYSRTMDRMAGESKLLKVGYLATGVFGLLTIIGGMATEGLGGAFKAMMDWYAAVLGPVSVPLLFGMLIKRTTWRGALASWLGGFATFVLFKYWLTNVVALALLGAPPDEALAWTLTTGAELLVTFAIFLGEGYLVRKTPEEQARVAGLFERLEGGLEAQAGDGEASGA